MMAPFGFTAAPIISSRIIKMTIPQLLTRLALAAVASIAYMAFVVYFGLPYP